MRKKGGKCVNKKMINLNYKYQTQYFLKIRIHQCMSAQNDISTMLRFLDTPTEQRRVFSEI